jgi:hypothetical protein
MSGTYLETTAFAVETLALTQLILFTMQVGQAFVQIHNGLINIIVPALRVHLHTLMEGSEHRTVK